MTKVHVLKSPMLLASPKTSKAQHLLPAGTTLYFDKSFPEGFTRYKVYVNVDRFPLTLTDQADPNSIDPIEAAPIDVNDLRKLLNDYPLGLDDLAAILKSSKLGKEDIRKVLEEYSR
jgi:hypothetical protein